MEVTSGILEAILPVELISTTELKLINSYQWQPLQNFVTISKHFTVKAKGLRFQATIDVCNVIVKQLKYYATESAAVLTIGINDMGNYGCFPDCKENMSKPLLAEANVNLFKRKLQNSGAAHALGFMIILEFLVVFSLGIILLFYTCKCATSLINERMNPDKKDTEPGTQTSGEQMVQEQVAEKPSRSAGCFPNQLLLTSAHSFFCQRSWHLSRRGTSTRKQNQNLSQPGTATDVGSLSKEKS